MLEIPPSKTMPPEKASLSSTRIASVHHWAIIMVASLYVSTVAVLAVCGQVLATALPEPLIFHSLTMVEFHAKQSEFRNRTTTHSVHLDKRVAFKHENMNTAEEQALVEKCSKICQTSFSEKWRASSGTCPASKPKVLHISCSHIERTGTAAVKQTSRRCPKDNQLCRTRKVTNFKGKVVKMSYCADVFPVDEEEEVEVVPHPGGLGDYDFSQPKTKYDGKKTLPDEVMSPGTIDFFYEVEGAVSGGGFAALKANFYYAGRWPSGNLFRARSPLEPVSSWCCMGCPPGQLEVQTATKGRAVGFSVDSWLL